MPKFGQSQTIVDETASETNQLDQDQVCFSAKAIGSFAGAKCRVLFTSSSSSTWLKIGQAILSYSGTRARAHESNKNFDNFE